MAIDFSSIDAIVAGFTKVLNLSSIGGPPPVPSPLILIGVPLRAGLSPTKIASNIIARKSEAGQLSSDEIMERIRIEEIVKALQQDAIISVSIPPGITLTAAGISPTGPVTVFGATITLSKGYGVIQ
jgi:hypothetical protein